MSLLLLTREERERFAAWCEQDAATTEGLIAQMEQAKAPDFVVQKLRIEAMCAKAVAIKLRSVQEDSVG